MSTTSDPPGGRWPRDHDFLEGHDGTIFCVVGCDHPPDGYVAYPQYRPVQSPAGSATRGYVKVPSAFTPEAMESLLRALGTWAPAYLRDGGPGGLPVVPRHAVRRYLASEERLREILDHPRDALEDLTRRLAVHLAQEANVPLTALGVTGSILAGVHDAATSDIDLLVIGRDPALKLRAAMTSGAVRRLAPVGEARIAAWIRSLIRDYPLTIEAAWYFVDRRWNCRSFEGRFFSVFPVRDGDDLRRPVSPHGSSLGWTCLRAVIRDAGEALFFLPARYALEQVKVLEGSGADVREMISYDGLYVDAFDEGARVEMRGEVESLPDGGCRLVVGGPSAAGPAYARPLF